MHGAARDSGRQRAVVTWVPVNKGGSSSGSASSLRCSGLSSLKTPYIWPPVGRTLPLGHGHRGTWQSGTMALTTTLTLPTFSGQDSRKFVLDFIDNLFMYSTVSSVSESDVLRRVLPVALRGNAERCRQLQPLFQSWNQFVAAFLEEFLPVASEYRIRRELGTQTQHPEEGLRDYVWAMQKLFRWDPTAPEAIKVSHVMQRCHPCFKQYLLGRSFPFEELARFAQQIAEPSTLALLIVAEARHGASPRSAWQ